MAIALLQRKCACGDQAEKDQSARTRTAAIQNGLRSPGQTLAETTRRFFESRFEHDFSSVRVHTDAAAGESAHALNARAYTLGSDMVFSSGEYAPQSSAGRRLLGHELIHVMQQSDQVQRMSIGGEPKIEIGQNDALEREADEVSRDLDEGALKRVRQRGSAAHVQRAPASAGDDLGTCMEKAGADAAECSPSAPLTWADFKGSPKAKDKAGADTFATHKLVPVASQQCLKQVAGKTTGPAQRFQAVFLPASSWVKPNYRNGGDPTKNGCAKYVSDCEAWFDQQAAAGRSGGWWALSTKPTKECPAAPTSRGDKATSKAGCATVVVADCNDQAVADSERLLSHEQGHFDIACALVKKANAALAKGGDLTKLNTALNTKSQPLQVKYDKESSHGCDAGGQTKWTADIAGGLPKVKIP